MHKYLDDDDEDNILFLLNINYDINRINIYDYINHFEIKTFQKNY